MDSTKLTEAIFAFLPIELLGMIGDFLNNSRDLSNLARVNQTFYLVFNRLLYKAAVRDHHPSPTIAAASNGNLGALKLAAEHGANLNYHQVKPLTAEEISAKDIRYQMSPHARWGAPLHFAIIYGHQDVVEWLISSGVDIEAPARLYCGCDNLDNIFQCYEPFRTHFDNDVMVWTPLHYAICHKQTEIAHRLLTAGSSPLCSIPARPELWPPGLEILEELYSDRATEIRHRRVYNNLYDNTCSLYGGRNDSITALDTAVVVGDKSVVTRLIKDMEMDPNWRKSALNSKIFQYSAVSGDESMIDHLLSLGCGSKLLLTAESDSGHTSFPIYIAFRMHHPSAASKLVVCGTSIWSKEAVWNYETKESIEKPIPLLSKVLAGWGKWTPRLMCCGLVDKVCNHHEHDIAAKKRAFFKLAKRTIDEVPHELSVHELNTILAEGLISMFYDADFHTEDFSEYVRIISPALEKDVDAQFRQSALSLLVSKNRDLYRFAQMPAVLFLLDDQWFGRPITQVNNALMRATLKKVVGTIPRRERDHYFIMNPGNLIRALELLRVHGAWEDAREQSEGPCTEEQSPWTLAGTIVKSEECPQLSGKWKRIRTDALKIIPPEIRYVFKRIRWES